MNKYRRKRNVNKYKLFFLFCTVFFASCLITIVTWLTSKKQEIKEVLIKDEFEGIPGEKMKDFTRLKKYWDLNSGDNLSLKEDLAVFQRELDEFKHSVLKFARLSIHTYNKLGWLFPNDEPNTWDLSSDNKDYPLLDKRISKILKKNNAYRFVHELIIEIYLKSIGFIIIREKGKITAIPDNGFSQTFFRRRIFFHFSIHQKTPPPLVGYVVYVGIYRFLMFVSRNYSSGVANQFLNVFITELGTNNMVEQKEAIEWWEQAIDK